MGRPPACPSEEKARIVLELLAGRLTAAQAAAEAGVSVTSIGNWKRQFLHAAADGLAMGAAWTNTAALEAENKALAARVREAVVLLKVWQMSARVHGRARREDELAAARSADGGWACVDPEVSASADPRLSRGGLP